jgi:hypothetical protein
MKISNLNEHEMKLIISALLYKSMMNQENPGAKQFEDLAEKIEKEHVNIWK